MKRRPPMLAGGLLGGAGLIDLLADLSDLSADPYVIITPQGLDHLDITGWIWLEVIISAVTVLAGLLAFTGRPWTTWLAIGMAVAGILDHLVIFPYHPLLAVLIVALDLAAIRLLVVYLRHGRTAADPGSPGSPGGFAPIHRSGR